MRYFDNSNGNYGLSNVALLQAAPCVFTKTASYLRDSNRYSQYSTCDVIEALRDEGYHPVSVRTNGTRLERNNTLDTRKHVVHLTHVDYLGDNFKKGDERPEIVITNSHDGSSSYQIFAGLFRKVCENGLVAAQSNVAEHRIRHMGHDFNEIIDASLKTAKDLSNVVEAVEEMKNCRLTEKEAKEFAKLAADLRFGENKHDNSESLLTLRRREDAWEPTLWNTFNVIQENLIKGGQMMNGRVMRPINNIERDISLNRNLWRIAHNKLNTNNLFLA